MWPECQMKIKMLKKMTKSPKEPLYCRCVQKLESPHQEYIWRIFPGEGREIATSVGNLKLPFPFFLLFSLLLLLLLFFFVIFFLLLVAWLQRATSNNTKTKDFDTSSRHICWARPPGIAVYQNSFKQCTMQQGLTFLEWGVCHEQNGSQNFRFCKCYDICFYNFCDKHPLIWKNCF